MKKSLVLLLCLFSVFIESSGEEDSLVIFFWNVENLFHPGDDSLHIDEEFTPGGERFWSWRRYYSKTARIWKTIIAAGNSRPPPLICLVEIENTRVLKDLFIHSPPGKFGYKIIHEESEDRRGIDVAMLYDSERLKLGSFRTIKVDLKEIGGGTTRDILMADFKFRNSVFTVFLNHWPSKYGGAGVTESFRMKAAKVLVNHIRVLCEEQPGARIICLGDFNDTEESNAMNYLKKNGDLQLLSYKDQQVEGTLKFHGRWENIDHILVSKNMFVDSDESKVKDCFIFSPDFLLEEDNRYGGKKPYRTWNGFSFREGFSDHLPVMLILSF
ncbi:MAG: endonuclease/exonuclease/phosphatase family protein [Bacteroidota bacterium]